MGHFHPFPIAMLKKQRVHDGFGRVIKGSTPPIWIEYWSFMVFQFGNPGRGSGKQQAASVAATMVTTPPVGGTFISLMLGGPYSGFAVPLSQLFVCLCNHHDHHEKMSCFTHKQH